VDILSFLIALGSGGRDSDSVHYTAESKTAEQKAQARANIDAAVSPTAETYTIATSAWSALASSTPFTYSATVTAEHTIGQDTVCELINDNAVLFGTYGFAIGAVSGQSVTIYSIGLPSASVSLEVDYYG